MTDMPTDRIPPDQYVFPSKKKMAKFPVVKIMGNEDRYTVFTAAYREKLERVLAIVGQYHYDASNSMVDYFDTNFYISLYTKPAEGAKA